MARDSNKFGRGRGKGGKSRRGGGRGRGGGGYRGGGGGGHRGPPREMHSGICADCGKQTEVPFKPTGDRAVYCRDCYDKHRPKY